jgi:hypothetical protein
LISNAYCYTIRLIALKEKLAHEKKHLAELEKTMYVPFPSAIHLGKYDANNDGSEDLSKESGGEHH